MRRPNFDFVGRVKTWAIVSAALMLLSVAALLIGRLDLSIDFVGGSSFVVEGITEEITATELRAVAEEAGAEDVTAQMRTEGDRATGAIVRTAALDPGSPEELEVKDALQAATGAFDIQFNFVGPTWGQRISTKALQGLVIFLIVVTIFISLRLEFKMAVIAVVALVHDLVLTAGVYAASGFNVSPATVIAVLTILGYSLYDTVVVFDRVKENTAQLGQPGRRTYSEAVNRSMNDVLWRSVNTSMTSLLPVGSLLFLGSQLLGADTLQDLALALFVGMATGAYSSLFVAGPLLAWWREREPEMQRYAERAQRRARPDPGAPTTRAAVPDAELAPARTGDAQAAGAEGSTRPPARSGSGGTGARQDGDPGEPTGYVRGRGKKPRRRRR